MQNKPTEDEIYGKPLDLPDDDKYRPPSPHNKRNFTKPVLIILALFALGGIGYGGWLFFTSSDTPDETAQEQTNNEEDIPENDLVAAGADITSTFELETERTTRPRLEITYPDTWSLFEQDDAVVLESPAFSYTTRTGQEVDDGSFKLYFRQGAREVDSSYIGRGVAALASQTITYSDPALGQREDTNLQYFGLDTSDHIAFFLIAGNFQLSPGDTLGPDYGREADAYIIAGGYTSPELEDDLQMHPVSAEYFRSTNAFEQALDIIKTLRIL